MLITCLPYLYAAAVTPPGMTFSRLLYQVPDNCVYLSWEEQAAQGAFAMRNLFTGEAQRGMYLHLLSWLLGTIARLTGLPVVLVHHVGRMVLGVLVLILAYRLFARCTPDVATRRTAFWFTAFASGFGWLAEWLKLPPQWSTELAQAEMTTFPSLCSNVLNCAGLTLMLGIFLLLLGAEEQCGKRRWRNVIGAGLLGLLLGNVHSYDVFTVAGVEQIFLAAVSDAQWLVFCDVLGFDDLKADPGYATNNQRVVLRPQLLGELRKRLANRTADELARTMERAGLPFAPIRRPEDLYDDPHLAATGGLAEVRLPDGAKAGETVKTTLLPFTMAGSRLGVRLDPPKRGEHTRELLTQLGLGAGEIDELYRQRAIA